jgi:5'-methylthioinosine phosphorylase
VEKPSVSREEPLPLGLIVGTGYDRLGELEVLHREVVPTPWGEASSPVVTVRIEGRSLVLLARHGFGHTILPHLVNYRANVWALARAGARRVVALASVGSLDPARPPGTLAIPDQIVDYTHGRASTFHEEARGLEAHVDFTEPYDARLRAALLAAAARAGLAVGAGGVYGVTQGPRLETAAEIARLRRDGCTLVGMTAMPEAVLARELGLAYATCAMVVNWAAGIVPEPIHEGIAQSLARATAEAVRLIRAFVRSDGG